METYKIGDLVVLTPEYDEEFFVEGMRPHLGTVVEIKDIEYNEDLEEGDDEYILYTYYDDVEDLYWQVLERHILGLASSTNIEEFERLKEEEKRKKEEKIAEIAKRHPELIYSMDRVGEIAVSIFGKDRVRLESINEITDIIIHFPEFIITNSKGHSHKIRDLYFSITISNVSPELFDDEDSQKAYIELHGLRTTYSVKEWSSGIYNHSHMNAGYGWQNFCVGAGVFATLILDLQKTLSEESWNLFFMSIPNYLSWESLEGGPYRRIAELSLKNVLVPIEQVEASLLEFVDKLSPQCFEYTDSRFIPLRGPLLEEQFSTYSVLRSLSLGQDEQKIAETAIQEFKKRVEDNPKNFLEGVEPIIYPETTSKKEEGNIPLDPNLITRYYNILENRSQKFLNTANYDRQKRKNRERVFSMA